MRQIERAKVGEVADPRGQRPVKPVVAQPQQVQPSAVQVELVGHWPSEPVLVEVEPPEVGASVEGA